MEWTEALALLLAMAVLAAVPSLSVVLVASRAAALGFGHGLATAAGVVLGDLVFVALAVFGLSVLVTALGGAFAWIQGAAGFYLLWLALALWRQTGASSTARAPSSGSRWTSLAAGLLLTLGDQKALLFYFAFFPGFVDLDALQGRDLALIAGITLVAVGGVKAAYAWLAARSGRLLNTGWSRPVARAASTLLILTGLLVLLRAVTS